MHSTVFVNPNPMRPPYAGGDRGMRKVRFHHPREVMIGMHFLSLFLADISRSKSRGMKLRGLDQAFGTLHRVVSYILGIPSGMVNEIFVNTES